MSSEYVSNRSPIPYPQNFAHSEVGYIQHRKVKRIDDCNFFFLCIGGAFTALGVYHIFHNSFDPNPIKAQVEMRIGIAFIVFGLAIEIFNLYDICFAPIKRYRS